MKRVSVEVMVAAVRSGQLETLLVRQPGNRWALPGGPVGRRPLQEAARCELAEQTGVRDPRLEQLFSFDRDAGAALCVAYLALVSPRRQTLTPGAELVEVRWFPVADRPELSSPQEQVLDYGRERLRAKASYSPIALHLLPEEFTLGDLHEVYEAALGSPLDVRNFRRDVLSAEIVVPVGRKRADGPGRPAMLYRAAGEQFAVLARERRLARAVTSTSIEGGST